MQKNLFYILFFLCFSFSYGQKEAANWFFGEFAGLNFNGKTVTPLRGKLATREGCAAISNRKGALLFYTDGSNVYDRNHQLMPNGSELYGNNSSTQSAIIVPHPLESNLYYIITVNNAEKIKLNEEKRGLNYSIVDMNLNNGTGDVLPESKNTHLITYNVNDAKQSEWKCSEKVAATIHGDGNAYWVLTHFVDTFYAFKIDETGMLETPVKSKVNETIPIVELQDINTVLTNITALGYLKISPNGKKVAIAHSATAGNRTSGKVFLYDFDNTTGMVSPSGTQLIAGTYPYGVEFSPKSRKLYATTSTYTVIRGVATFEGSNLYQFDLESPNVLGSKTEIHSSGTLLAGALQLAINGKIYRAKSKPGEGEPNLAAIDKPELAGRDAAYIASAVDLLPGTKANYGLPPFISSTFILTFDYENTCFGDDTHFFITSEDPYDTLIWDFGDGTTSTDPEPYHRYAQPGEYTVSLTTTYNSFTNNPLKKKVEIVETIDLADQPYTIIECDVDSDPEDGITTFNLQLANDGISLGRGNEVDVFYYKDLATLNIDTLNIKALPNFYTNTIPEEPLYAKVSLSGSDCYSVAEVILKANRSFEFVADKIFGCNQGDGTALFDLGGQKQVIISQLNLLPDTKITFHESKNDAALGYQPFADLHNGPPGTTYIRLENGNICSGIGEMELDMPALPDINLDETLDVCLSDFPIKIDGGVDATERQNYSYEWLSGEQSYDKTVAIPGDYYLTITDKSSLCSTVKSIQVNAVDAPQVKLIALEEHSTAHMATVVLNNEGNFEYALGSAFGPYQSSPEFDGLAPGTYTVYVRDLNNCNVVQKNFFIFGFPRFFTPNADGDSDVWEIKGINKADFTYSDIQIFNRFGKLLAVIPADGHWDGTYGGRLLPSDDYWFNISVTDSDNITTNYTKHFSLIHN